MSDAELAVVAALGPLATFYSDPAVTAILVDGPDRAYIARRGEYRDAPGLFATAADVRALIDALFALSGKLLNDASTVGEVRLPDGSRCVAAIPPTSGVAPSLTIRRLSAAPLDWDKLVALGIVSPAGRDLLVGLARSEVGILFAGGSGSGKRAIANLFAESIGDEQRIVVVQDRLELTVRHPHTLHLQANLTGAAPIPKLLEAAGRMEPDWLVLCDVRGEDTLASLQALGAATSGLAVVHADSADDVLVRIETQCRLVASGLRPLDVRRIITSAIQIVVYLERLPVGRRVIQIDEIYMNGDRIEAQALFRYNHGTDSLQTGGIWAAERTRQLSTVFSEPVRRSRTTPH